MPHKNENDKKDGLSQAWGRQIRNPQLLSFQIRYGMSFGHSDPFQRPVLRAGGSLYSHLAFQCLFRFRLMLPSFCSVLAAKSLGLMQAWWQLRGRQHPKSDFESVCIGYYFNAEDILKETL